MFMDEVNLKMGTLEGIQIRAEAKVHEYFYNNVQVGVFCVIFDTICIHLNYINAIIIIIIIKSISSLQRGFCETRIINQTLSLFFVGSKPLVFKPGMPFDAQIAVRYHDQVIHF